MAETLDKDTDALVAELRATTMFERFDEEQLRWVVEHGEHVRTAPGETLHREGDRFSGISFLLDGELEILIDKNGVPTTAVISTTPGAWAGGAPILDEVLAASARTPVSSRLLRLDAQTSVDLVRDFPVAHHIVRGLREGAQRWQEQVDQQEHLAALGRLSAGLAHELNNPAAAARRAATTLRDAATRMRSSTVALAQADGSPGLATTLNGLERELLVTMQAAEPLSALERSDREDALGSALRARGCEDADPVPLVDAGIDVEWLERFTARFPPAASEVAMRWLLAQVEVTQIASEVEDAAGRISDLVRAIKDYTYMDRDAGAYQADIHDGLESTLAMLRYRLRGITVVRDYDRTLPRVPVHGAELNQVWTNLIDNAADALDGKGTLTVTTRRDGDDVVVVLADDGPGIPPDALPRVFEPFFTTKPVGKGTGLGLDIAHRIVTEGHHGVLQVASKPGDTRFTVRLPATAAAAAAP
jgi:signal transduction histidine kinase